jgi:hypothetical protein
VLQKQASQLDMPHASRFVQGGNTAGVPGVDVRAAFDEHLRDLGAAPEGGLTQCGFPVSRPIIVQFGRAAAPDVGARAFVEQAPDDLSAVEPHGAVKGGPAGQVPGFARFGALFENLGNTLDVVAGNRSEDVHFHTGTREGPDRVLISAFVRLLLVLGDLIRCPSHRRPPFLGARLGVCPVSEQPLRHPGLSASARRV